MKEQTAMQSPTPPAVRAKRRTLLVTAVALCLAAAGGASASPASADGPALQLSSEVPTFINAGETSEVLAQVRNVGDAPTTGTITLTIALPTGVSATASDFVPNDFQDWHCGNVVGATVVTCQYTSPLPARAEASLIFVYVSVPGNASGQLVAHFAASGGGAPAAQSSDGTMTVGAPTPGLGLLDFDGTTVDAEGFASTQAGAHPYATSVRMRFRTRSLLASPGAAEIVPTADFRDVHVALPSGFVGNPSALPKCTPAQLATQLQIAQVAACPPETQVGMAIIRTGGTQPLWFDTPIFNVEPPAGAPAAFGFVAQGVVVLMTASIRSDGDYGVTIDVPNTTNALPILSTDITFWGVPSDSSHDFERTPCQENLNLGPNGQVCPSGASRAAFLTNPTACSGPLETGLRINTYLDPTTFLTSQFFSHLPGPDAGVPAGITGCDRVPFDPTIGVASTTQATSSPTGLTFDLSVPQDTNPDGIAQSALKTAVVQLPEGIAVNPSSATGLAGCAPSDIKLHTLADPTCPDASKIGTVRIDTPLLDVPLEGSIYLATQGTNPFGSLLALYLVAKGPGVILKLPGKVEPNPVTGQLTATFDDNPQLPFSNLHLAFKSGPRAPLMSPATCGAYTTQAQLTSWSGRTVAQTGSFTLSSNSAGGPCSAAGFSPSFSAGTENAVAGGDSPFVVSVTRGDGDQQLDALNVGLPPGLLGRIASTVLCSNVDANAGTCGEASKVGSVTVGAGAGPNPFFITNGRAYITGPYKGAPFGLSIVVPAVAGPFDLGNVVVRAAIQLDRHSAALRVVSDALPRILQGIPLDVRVVRVAVDRRRFIVNPTSCAAKTVTGTIASTLGAIAHVSSPFQVDDCASLPLAPKLSLTVGAPHRTGANVSTPFTATLTQTPGQSNLQSVSVVLPTTLNARLPVINRACTLAQFEAGHCSSRARAGSAVAVTPLLRHALRGSAYFVKNPRRALPDLMVALRGQVSVDLTGKVTIPGGTRLATRFDTIPDVPITKFTLRLVAGGNGPLGTVANLCTARSRAATAAVGFRGQNGKLVQLDERLHVLGCPKARKTRR